MRPVLYEELMDLDASALVVHITEVTVIRICDGSLCIPWSTSWSGDRNQNWGLK